MTGDFGKKPSRPHIVLYAALLLLLPVSILLQALAARDEKAVELFYSRGVYRLVSGALSRYFGLFPFSCAELLLYAAVLFAAFLLAVAVRRLARRQFMAVLRLMLAVISVFTAGCFLFTALWGLNYNRLPLEQNLRYKTAEAKTAGTAARMLGAALKSEVAAINALCADVRYDKNGRSHYAGGFAKLSGTVGAGYAALAQKSDLYNTLFGGATARPKEILASRLLSYTGVEGIYIPFTCEPNVNTDMPDFVQPFDAAHECAHFKGFAREDEANFIAYLADTANPDPYFRYSAHMEAYIYLSNALYAADRKAWQSIAARLDRRARGDLSWYNAYIAAHESKAADISNSINDNYLKAQGQSGVVTYGRFVVLLLDKQETEG